MSVKIMGLVWDADLERELKFVLLAYADHADHDGGGIWPAVETVAWKTGYTERQIVRLTKKLREMGILVLEGRSAKRTNVYRIDLNVLPIRERPARKQARRVVGDKMSPTMDGGEGDIPEVEDDILATEDDISAVENDMAMSPDPSLEPSLEPSNKTTPDKLAVSSRPDFLDLAKRTFEKTKGKGSWTVTEEAGGADPWQDGPLTAFCELVKVEQPPPKLVRGWARAIQAVAEEWGAVPAQAAQAIRLIPDSEHKWHTFSSPHDKGFQSVLGIMIDRVITGGREDTAPTKVELW